MKRLALAFLLVLASYSVSSAQQVGAPVIIYSPLSGTSQPQFPVTSTNPFPVVCESGCSGGGSSGAVFGPTAAGSPAANPPVLIGGTVDGTATGNVDNWKVVSGVGFVNCANCSGSGVSQTDEAAFTAGTSLFAPGGGFYQTTATSNPLTTGQQGLWQMTANRAGFVNLRNASGTEIGTAAAPVQVSVANTGANATALLTTGTGGTFPVTGTFWPYTLGQQLAANSVPVVLTAAQLSTLTPLAWSNSNQIGNTSFGAIPQPSSSSTNGLTPSTTAALASNQVLKGSAGNLYSFEVSADSTLSAAAWWIMVFNATSLPADGAVTPAKCYAIPSGQPSASYAWNMPVQFSTGITIGVSTTGCFTKTASVHAFISGDVQ